MACALLNLWHAGRQAKNVARHGWWGVRPRVDSAASAAAIYLFSCYSLLHSALLLRSASAIIVNGQRRRVSHSVSAAVGGRIWVAWGDRHRPTVDKRMAMAARMAAWQIRHSITACHSNSIAGNSKRTRNRRNISIIGRAHRRAYAPLLAFYLASPRRAAPASLLLRAAARRNAYCAWHCRASARATRLRTASALTRRRRTFTNRTLLYLRARGGGSEKRKTAAALAIGHRNGAQTRFLRGEKYQRNHHGERQRQLRPAAKKHMA